jgi:hypothetical protein
VILFVIGCVFAVSGIVFAWLAACSSLDDQERRAQKHLASPARSDVPRASSVGEGWEPPFAPPRRPLVDDDYIRDYIESDDERFDRLEAQE